MFKVPKIDIPNINLNLLMVFGVTIGVIFIGYKIKGGIDSAKAAIGNIDLDPFDEGSYLPSTLAEITAGFNNIVIQPGQDAQLVKAFSDKGLSVFDYKLYTGGGRGSVIPKNAVYIVVGRTGNYYVPKFNF